MVMLPHRRRAFSARLDLASNLVLRWRMDEASGNLTDSNTAGAPAKTGIIYSSPTRTTGKYGNGLNLVRASSQWAEESTNDPSFFNTDFTLCCWVNPNAWGPPGNYSGVFRKGLPYSTPPATHYLVEVLLDSSGKLLAHLWGAAGAGGVMVVPIGQWTHVAIVRTPTTVTIYQNGIMDGTPYTRTTAAGGAYNRHALGKPAYNVHVYFDGKLDDYRAYNKALTAAELAAIAAGTDLQTP